MLSSTTPGLWTLSSSPQWQQQAALHRLLQTAPQAVPHSLLRAAPRTPHRLRQPPQRSAAQPVVCESEARDLGDNSANPVRCSELPDGPSPFLDTAAGEAAEDVSDTINDLEITTLTNTTSLHDDWLHRGPFLADLDLHTYIAHVVRSPRPAAARVSDIQRFQDVFLFDDHYELARSHWQELQTSGFHVLPMLEALRCQPPDLNNGECNAGYKTLSKTKILN